MLRFHQHTPAARRIPHTVCGLPSQLIVILARIVSVTLIYTGRLHETRTRLPRRAAPKDDPQ